MRAPRRGSPVSTAAVARRRLWTRTKLRRRCRPPRTPAVRPLVQRLGQDRKRKLWTWLTRSATRTSTSTSKPGSRLLRRRPHPPPTRPHQSGPVACRWWAKALASVRRASTTWSRTTTTTTLRSPYLRFGVPAGRTRTPRHALGRDRRPGHLRAPRLPRDAFPSSQRRALGARPTFRRRQRSGRPSTLRRGRRRRRHHRHHLPTLPRRPPLVARVGLRLPGPPRLPLRRQHRRHPPTPSRARCWKSS